MKEHNDKRGTGRWRRILKYTAIGTACIIIVAGTVGLYEYNRLQPANHFRNVPTLGQPVAHTGSANTGNPTNFEGRGTGGFNILLFGSDARPAGSSTGLSVNDSHTDSIMLIHANLSTHQYNVLSIPRDTRVNMPGFGDTKITSVQMLAQSKDGEQRGTLDAVRFISNFVGVPINYYAETSSWGLQSMVETLGGITMDIPFSITLNHAAYPQDAGLHLSAGPHFVNGQLFTDLVHDRYDAPGTDYGRQQLQAAALVGIVRAVMKPSNVTKIPELANQASECLMSTNITTQDMISLAFGVKGSFSKQQVHYFQVDGTEAKVYNAPLSVNDDEVLLNLDQLKQIIEEHFT